MQIRSEPTALKGAFILHPEVFLDERGYFTEIFHADQFKQLGLPHQFVQMNQSGSKKNVVRGLHFQWDPPMGKLMRVTRGVAFLVAVDLRKGSPSLGKWVGVEASEENRKMFWAPASFARGFCALSEFAVVEYQCTGTYNSKGESGVRWNDPDIGVQWPVKDPLVSDKDGKAQSFREWLAHPASDNFKI